jgi:4a-hydroxytetrahydrobiopterin dehydratase
LRGEELAALHRELGGGWDVVDEHHLWKTYEFPDFRTALEAANKLGELAEEVGHHPEITLSWGKVAVELYTHKIGGLAEADFVWAARADRRLQA